MKQHSPRHSIAHLCYARTTGIDQRVLDVARPLLEEWEERRLAAFKFDADRITYALAHFLTRVALCQLHPARLSDWRLDRTAAGRPFVTEPVEARWICFSLSHAHGFAGCIAAQFPVGFDVEIVDDALDVEAVLPQVMAPIEIAKWKEQPVASRTRHFLRHWTLKEAITKALGVGLTTPLSNFVFAVQGSETAKLVMLPTEFGHPEAWSVQLLDLGGSHVAAIAMAAPVGVVPILFGT